MLNICNRLPAVLLLVVLWMSLWMPAGFQDARTNTPEGQRGPVASSFTFLEVTSPGVQRIAYLNGWADYWPFLRRTSDVEASDTVGKVLQRLDSNFVFMGWNVRDSLLGQVNFRHALRHALDLPGLLPSLYGYTATPRTAFAALQWLNNNVDDHPFNLGNVFTSPAGEHSTVGILLANAFTFVDTEPYGIVNLEDYWKDPLGNVLKSVKLYSPLCTEAPLLYTLAASFVQKLHEVGLNNIIHEGRAIEELIHRLYHERYEEAYGWIARTFLPETREIDILIRMWHSRDDLLGALNAAGVADYAVDLLGDKARSFIYTAQEKLNYFRQLQEKWAGGSLMDRLDVVAQVGREVALSLWPVARESRFSAFKDDILNGVINVFNHFETARNLFENIGSTDGRSVNIIDEKIMLDKNQLGDIPIFNAVGLTRLIVEGGLKVNVYSNRIEPHIWANFQVQLQPAHWLRINLWFRSSERSSDAGEEESYPICWQDGRPYTVDDAIFNWEFLKNHQIPSHLHWTQFLVDVTKIDENSVTVLFNSTNEYLLHDLSETAALLPPQIWDRQWLSTQAILDYHPIDHPYGTDLAPGYSLGPWAANVSTNLLGTGAFIFQTYDPVNLYADLVANRNYWRTTAEIQNEIAEKFYGIGDYNRDGVINVVDLTYVAFAYGTHESDPDYDPDADFNQDGWVNMWDISNAAYHMLWQKEWP